MLKRITALLLVLGFIFTLNVSIAQSAATIAVENKVTDLSRAYEVWKNKGIKFVVRDEKGKFVTWNTGHLESWASKSKWVVRDTKGKFLHHANGNVESWKNGKTRLVIRDPKGRLMTHIDVGLTDKGTYYSTVVGLRKLKNDNFLEFVQKRLADILIIEIKDNQLTKARVLITYLEKYKNEGGVSNFKPVLKQIQPTINFMLVQNPNNKRLQELSEATKEMAKSL
jgi:hypothetical protein